MYRRMALGLLAWACLISAAAHGQSRAVDALYGKGVHAYHAGRLERAHDLLTQAIDAGSLDPRVWYYRGLTSLRLGDEADARQDFTSGANHEMGAADRFYNVSKALERVQGRARLMLEEFRSEARMVAHEELARQRELRYERIRRIEPRVLAPAPESPPPAAPATSTRPATPPPAPTTTRDAAAPTPPSGVDKADTDADAIEPNPFDEDAAEDEMPLDEEEEEAATTEAADEAEVEAEDMEDQGAEAPAEESAEEGTEEDPFAE